MAQTVYNHVDMEKQSLAGSTKPYSSRLLSNTWFQFILGVINPGLFGVIIVFVQATFDAQSKSDQNGRLANIDKLDVSFTLAFLRVIQAVLSTLTAFSLNVSFEIIQWSLVGTETGLSFYNLLALSPTTGTLGMLRLLGSFSSSFTSKCWTILRGSLMLMLWVSTLVLFFQTSQVTIYDTSQVYSVTAGVGPFNGSYVLPFVNLLQGTQADYPFQVLPYNYFAPVYNLVTNPTFSSLVGPVNCEGVSCYSYLLTGGLEMVTPWVSLQDPAFPLVRIHNVPSVQLEFSEMPNRTPFISEDCSIFGTNTSTIAARLCLTEDETAPGSLYAGMYICANGTADRACEVDTTVSVPNITTKMSVFTRHTTVVAGLANFSIVSTEALSPPIQLTNIDLVSYRMALDWLLNYTAANVPAPSSIIESFWVSDAQLRSPATHGLLTQSFQSILAFPFWLFNANNYGNTALKTQDMISTLPPEFYTQASVVAPYGKIGFDRGMFIAFIVLQGAALIFIWTVLAWVWIFVGAGDLSSMPKITSFPLFDVGFKSRVDGLNIESEDELLKADGSEALYLVRYTNAKTKRNW